MVRILFAYPATLLAIFSLFVFSYVFTEAQVITSISTTTVSVSICGDSVVNPGEECDVPGETGTYSTTIAGRQCDTTCQFGPYCGDAILQTIHDEECDDGNNTDDDFCSADCKQEFVSGGGGGSSSGSGSGGSGGSTEEQGDTEVTVSGRAYPRATVNILEDGSTIGTVTANSTADFTFTEDVDPGTTSFSFWATDDNGIRSITFSTTFDVTQGAVTSVEGILIPPTIELSNDTVNRGDIVTISGQSAPDVTISLHVGSGGEEVIETTTTDGNGDWSIDFNTAQVSEAAHTAKARFSYLSGGRTLESTFSTAVSLFVGVSPDTVITSSDLNTDGSVNLVDFSILIFWWGTNGGNSNPRADINGNGNVGLEDFSILLFNWTG